MIPIEIIDIYLSKIIELYANQSVTIIKKISESRSILRSIFRDFSREESQYFSSTFAQITYFVDKYHLPQSLFDKIRIYRYKARDINKLIDSQDQNTIFCLGIEVLLELISEISNQQYSEIINPILNSVRENSPKTFDTVSSESDIHYLRAVVTDCGHHYFKSDTGSYSEIMCQTEESGEIRIYLFGEWSVLQKQIWAGATLNIFNIKKLSKGERTYSSTSSSLFVLEPDYLIDVTELSECFSREGFLLQKYLVNKYLPKSSSIPLVIGNLVNSCFDELILDSNVDFDETFRKALLTRPLQILAMIKEQPQKVKLLPDLLINHFEILKQSINEIHFDNCYIEPSFISPKYGFQGRLDLLCDYNDDPTRKDVLELKSGKAPRTDYFIIDDNKKQIPVGLWYNHLIQTSCYNLLLDSAFENRTGSSQILYSNAESRNLRNAPNIYRNKQAAILGRNEIVSSEHSFTQGDFSQLDNICSKVTIPIPEFIDEKIREFQKTYDHLNSLEKDYFREYSAFLHRESFIAKTGYDTERSGFSSLWKDSIEEKQKGFSLLYNLELMRDESDWTAMHLKFKLNRENAASTSFRKGDLAILWQKHEYRNTAITDQLLKCHILTISHEFLTVSLRNKLSSNYFSRNASNWILETDFTDMNNRTQLTSLYSFINSDINKKELLLCQRNALMNDIINIEYPELSAQQNEILSRAVSAKNYFLIQGPPGTGKTSFMLKYIVRVLYNSTDINILITAYTNRAVDEICNAIKSIDESPDLLRFGSKETTEHPDITLACLISHTTYNELNKRINRTRIFVSTIASLLSNPEIFKLKKFGIMIVDEASQILEPQIVGLLAEVDKFIMIGDEKQLPAITQQSETTRRPVSALLIESGIRDLGSSLFERLLRFSGEYSPEIIGSLSFQARMHSDIQAIPNQLFYNNLLRTHFDWQNDNKNRFSTESDNSIINLLSRSRTIFIDSPNEKNFKVHFEEARRVALICKAIYEFDKIYFSYKTIGVVSPFRAQCAEIYKMLDQNLRDYVLVDTVERFQGSERDIIIYSLSITYEDQLKSIQSVSMLDAQNLDRKLNVAITRAKHNLIILGNYNLIKNNIIYNQLVELIRKQNGFIENNEFTEALSE